MAKIKLHIILSLLGGLGLSFSLPFFNTGWLVWIGLVPFLLALSLVKKRSSSFWIGYFVGLIYFGFTFVWFWDAYPLKALAIDNRFGALTLIAIAWLFTAAGMALFWGIIAGLFKKIEPQISWTALLIFPSLFTFFEYLRSFFLSLLWTAPGAVYGPHWTAGNLSYSLSHSSPALFISSLMGIYGLTFLIVLVNVLLFLWLKHSQFKKAAILAVVMLVSTLFPFYEPPLSDQDKINAAIIQTAIPSQPDYSAPEQLANFRKQLELLDKVSQQYPETNLVVFPEGSNFFSSLSLFGNTQSLSRYFDKLFPSATIILDNIKTSEESFFKSKTVVLDSKNGPMASYEKRLLTPGGEYVPRLFREVDKIIGLNSSTLQQIREFSPGDISPSVISTADFSLRSLICSDISSPSLARQNFGKNLGGLARQNEVVPDVFTVQASFGFANGSSKLIAQTKAMARFRAAENQRALVFSSNFGPSFILSPQGKVLQETKNSGFEILTGELILNKSKSLYNKLGDGPIIMGSFGVLVMALFWTWRKREIRS